MKLISFALFFLIFSTPLTASSELTERERNYIEKQKEIVFTGQKNYPPFEFINKNGEYTGISVEMIRWMAAELGFNARFLPLPFEEAKQAILRGEADVLLNLFHSEQRESLFDFTEELFEIPASIFIKSERTDIKELADLEGKTIAMQEGDYALEFLQKMKISHQLLPTMNFFLATDSITEGQADVVIGDEQVVLFHIYRNNLQKKIKKVGNPIYLGRSCMAVKEGNETVLSILEKGIKRARNHGVLDKIHRKWIGVHYKSPTDPFTPYLVGIIFFAVFLLILGWNWTRILRRQVSRKTVQLVRTNRNLQQEISRRARIEAKLAEEKEQLSLTLRSIAEGVIVTDEDDRVTLMNRVAEKLTGFACSLSKGLPLDEVFRVEMLHDERDVKGDSLLISNGGEEHIVSYSVAPIRIEERTLGKIIVFRDMTERTKLEEQLAKASRIKSIGVLAGGIAHDFNNILSAILGNISLARFYSDPDCETVDMLLDAEKACERAKGLTAQLLTFAKGGAPVKENIRIEGIIRDSALFVLSGSNSSCTFRFEENIPSVRVDRGQIGQVIQNLVINADQAMPEGGTILIDLENINIEDDGEKDLLPGTYIRIKIKDEGIGMESEEMERIFDPYYTTKEKGSGLGLSIVYSIIKRHKGLIEVESTPGEGTLFTIYIPAGKEPVVLKKERKKLMRKGKGRVLFMDDEKIIRDLAGRIFPLIGFEIVFAEDGEEAIKIYTDSIGSGKKFDLVVLDLTIPGGLGGKETVRRIKKLDPKAVAIVVSGYANDPVIGAYRDYGFDGVVKKPFTPEEFSREIERVMPN